MAQCRVGTSPHVLLTGCKKNQSGASVDDTSSLRQDRRTAICNTLVDAPEIHGRRGRGQRTETIRSYIIG
jgi:hypothetical protein